MEGYNMYNSIDSCLQHCRDEKYTNAWIIGGQQIYELAMQRSDIDYLYLTKILQDFQCDTFFPCYEEKFECIKREEEKEKGISLLFEIYQQR